MPKTISKAGAPPPVTLEISSGKLTLEAHNAALGDVLQRARVVGQAKPEAEVEALLDHLEAALRWLGEYGDSDGDGFLEYLDTTGHGLANQGWKDSGDSIRWHDGSIAEGPIALCEVQGYVYDAKRGLAGAGVGIVQPERASPRREDRRHREGHPAHRARRRARRGGARRRETTPAPAHRCAPGPSDHS